jgi:ankyrin repeat protein
VYWIALSNGSRYPENLTNLVVASYFGHEAVVKPLLQKGAKLEVKDEEGQTPLFYARKGGHVAIVELLLQKGAERERQS